MRRCSVSSQCHLCPQERHLGLWTQIISPHSGHIHFAFSFRMKCLIPNSLIILRFSIILIPYFVLYRSFSCFNLLQGKWLQLTRQYLLLPLAITSQFLILHVMRCFIFWLFRLFRQPGQVFSSRMYPQQRRQFIPQGAINSIGIVRVFFFIFSVVIFVINSDLSPLVY